MSDVSFLVCVWSRGCSRATSISRRSFRLCRRSSRLWGSGEGRRRSSRGGKTRRPWNCSPSRLSGPKNPLVSSRQNCRRRSVFRGTAGPRHNVWKSQNIRLVGGEGSWNCGTQSIKVTCLSTNKVPVPLGRTTDLYVVCPACKWVFSLVAVSCLISRNYANQVQMKFGQPLGSMFQWNTQTPDSTVVCFHFAST